MRALTSTSVAAGRIVAEDLAVDRHDLVRNGDVGHEHPGPDDVARARSRPRPARAR